MRNHRRGADGNYTLQVPDNIENFPATGDYTLNLGPTSVDYATSDLLANLGHGTLTGSNDVVDSSTQAAIGTLAKRSKIVDRRTLGLSGADGTSITGLGTPATVTTHLTAAQITALSGRGSVVVEFYDPVHKTLVEQNATVDLSAGTVTYKTATLGTYIIALSTAR